MRSTPRTPKVDEKSSTSMKKGGVLLVADKAIAIEEFPARDHVVIGGQESKSALRIVDVRKLPNPVAVFQRMVRHTGNAQKSAWSDANLGCLIDSVECHLNLLLDF
jgi:hypothetical protein